MNVASPSALSNPSDAQLDEAELVEPAPDSHLRLTPLPPHTDDGRRGVSPLQSYTRRLGLPYVGLRPFSEADHDVFAGRSRELSLLASVLDSQHLAAVVGPAQSGRTSLIEGGLVGSLRRREAGSWRVARMDLAQSAGALHEGLEDAFIAACDEGVSRGALTDESYRLVQASLDGASDALLRAAGHVLHGTNDKLLLVIENFDLLTQVPGETELRLVRQLLRAAQQDGSRVFVVLSLSETAVGECGQFPGLAGALAGGMVVLEQPNRASLRAMITEPLKVMNWHATPALCEQLLGDLERAQAPLPALQHALLQMASHATSTGIIDLTTYTAAGCPDDLNAHGQALLQNMTDTEQELTRAVFQALLGTSAGRLTPRACSVLELAESVSTSVSDPTFKRILTTFGAKDCAFLRLGSVDPNSRVEIGTPALLTEWSSLRRWANSELAASKTYRSLVRSAQDEAGTSADSGFAGGLLRDPQLSDLEAWWKQRCPTMLWARRHSADSAEASDRAFETVIAYLARSRARANNDAKAKREAERLAQLEALTRRRKWRIVLGVGGTVLLIGGIALASVLHQRNDARSEARVAEAQLADATDDNVRLRHTEVRLLVELDEATNEVQSLESQLQLLESERQELIGTGAVLQESLDALQERHRQIIRAHDAALLQAKEAKAELQRARSELLAAESRASAAETAGTGVVAPPALPFGKKLQQPHQQRPE